MSSDPAAPCTLRESLGLFVLGALSPEDAAEVRSHLQECAACRHDHDYIAVVPSFLESLRKDRLEALLREPPAT